MGHVVLGEVEFAPIVALGASAIPSNFTRLYTRSAAEDEGAIFYQNLKKAGPLANGGLYYAPWLTGQKAKANKDRGRRRRLPALRERCFYQKSFYRAEYGVSPD